MSLFLDCLYFSSDNFIQAWLPVTQIYNDQNNNYPDCTRLKWELKQTKRALYLK